MPHKPTTCIYALTDPTTGEIRYVGKANDPRQRMFAHCWRSRHDRRDAASRRGRWIVGLLNTGQRPVVSVLERVPLRAWRQAERRWIHHFRERGAPLLNIHPGGLGARGGGSFSREQTVGPIVYCACGCGEKTLLAAHDNKRNGWVKGQPLRFLSYHHLKGATNPKYKGGLYTNPNGHRCRRVFGHPRGDKDGYVPVHLLTMEDRLGYCEIRPAAKVYRFRAEGRWSGKHDACRDCGTTAIPHVSHGRCRNCHVRFCRAHPERTWVGHPCCLACGTTAIYHQARGLCHTCAERQRRELPLSPRAEVYPTHGPTDVILGGPNQGVVVDEDT